MRHVRKTSGELSTLILMMLSLACAAPSIQAQPKTLKSVSPLIEAVKAIKPAIVFVQATKTTPDGEPSRKRQGLGIIVDSTGIGIVPQRLTEEGTILEVILDDGRKFTPRTSRSEVKAGIAIVKINCDKPFPVVELGNSDSIEQGDSVFSLGRAYAQELSVDRGLVSQLRRADDDERVIEVDSSRGSPPNRDLLFDRSGKFIGLWTGKSAIPSNCVRDAVRKWQSEN